MQFLLKTDSGYPKDTGVTLMTLTTTGNPLHYNIPPSIPPVSTTAHSRGPRKRSQSPVDMLERRDTYGQAQVCSKGLQGSSVARGKWRDFSPAAAVRQGWAFDNKYIYIYLYSEAFRGERKFLSRI